VHNFNKNKNQTFNVFDSHSYYASYKTTMNLLQYLFTILRRIKIQTLYVFDFDSYIAYYKIIMKFL